MRLDFSKDITSAKNSNSWLESIMNQKYYLIIKFILLYPSVLFEIYFYLSK
jgi:hypothetical protein